MIDKRICTKMTFNDLKVGDYYTDHLMLSYYVKTGNVDPSSPFGWGKGEFLGLPHTHEYYGNETVYRIDWITAIRDLDINYNRHKSKWRIPDQYKYTNGIKIPFNGVSFNFY